MRSLTRFGVAFAATALAGSTALAGAGIAGAQEAQPKPVFDSASSVTVEGKGKATKVSYTNKSEYDLYCFGFAGPKSLLGDVYSFYRSADNSDPESGPAELTEALRKADAKGQIGLYSGIVEKGKTAELVAGVAGTDLDGELTDGSFAPGAIVSCASSGEAQYTEIEVSPGVSVPTGLGSLDAALTGIGSSGSVAQTAGSLGS